MKCRIDHQWIRWRDTARVKDRSVLLILHHPTNNGDLKFVSRGVGPEVATIVTRLENVSRATQIQIDSEINRRPTLICVRVAEAKQPRRCGFARSHLHIAIPRSDTLRRGRARISPTRAG